MVMDIRKIIKEEVNDFDWVDNNHKLNSPQGWEAIKDMFELGPIELDLKVGDLVKSHMGKAVYEVIEIDKSVETYFYKFKNIFNDKGYSTHGDHVITKFQKLKRK